MRKELDIPRAALLPPAPTRDNQLCASHPKSTPLEYRVCGSSVRCCVFHFPFCSPRFAPTVPGGPGAASASPGGPCSLSLLGTTRALGCGAATRLGHIVSPSQLLALRIHH